jgi:hypothetical protein
MAQKTVPRLPIPHGRYDMSIIIFDPLWPINVEQANSMSEKERVDVLVKILLNGLGFVRTSRALIAPATKNDDQ